MGRLIDADALIEVLKNLSYFNADDMQELVASQPTAYDVEKVVAELEKEKTHETFCDKEVGFNKGIRKAIEMVKRGGAE